MAMTRTFWVFGYGSLMWDGWEISLEGARHEKAVVAGFCRSFNKASTKNWGTPSAPCPTLGLEPDPNAKCEGTAFEFSSEHRSAVLKLLRTREGKSFTFESAKVTLPSKHKVEAMIAVNDRTAKTYLGKSALDERAFATARAVGKDGSCSEYVSNLRSKLQQLDIIDPAVEEFHRAVWPEPRRRR